MLVCTLCYDMEYRENEVVLGLPPLPGKTLTFYFPFAWMMVVCLVGECVRKVKE